MVSFRFNAAGVMSMLLIIMYFPTLVLFNIHHSLAAVFAPLNSTDLPKSVTDVWLVRERVHFQLVIKRDKSGSFSGKASLLPEQEE